jgi:hypothetical protein
MTMQSQGPYNLWIEGPRSERSEVWKIQFQLPLVVILVRGHITDPDHWVVSCRHLNMHAYPIAPATMPSDKARKLAMKFLQSQARQILSTLKEPTR